MKLTSIILIILFISCQSNETKTSLNEIIDYYHKVKLPESYTLQYQEEHFIPYQSYDYKNPNGLIASYTTEINHTKKHLYNKSITNVGGGFTFEYITAIKDTIAFEYSTNKIWKGNIVDSVNAKENYNYFQKTSLNQISTYSVKEFLKNPIDSLSFMFDKNTNESIITKISKEDTLKYTFSTQPIRLKKISKKNVTYIFEKFKDYNGFSYATTLHFYRDNTIAKNVTISLFKDLNDIEPSKLLLPKGFTFKKPELKKENISKIGKNTYIIRDFKSNRNVLFTNINNEITVIGAPESGEFSKRVLDLIKNTLPNSNVKFVYVTHLHSDHIMGLKSYAKENITIIADSYTIDGIKDFKYFKDVIDTFKFKVIKDQEIFNGIQFHYPKNKHCKSQGFAYCMDDKIIYQGDFMQISPHLIEPTIMPETTKSFIERIHKSNLSVKTVISHHQAASEIPMKFLNTYYKNFND